MIKIPLAGVFARKLAAAMVRLGDDVVLEPEPSNPYDAQAIAVKHRGRLVGYVPRTMQADARPYMEAGARFVASGKGHEQLEITGVLEA